jgi:hypothetical protein
MAKGKEDLIDALYKFFISQGFSKYGAAYMVASLIRESRLNPAAVEKLKGGKVGQGRALAQWSFGKNSYKAMVAYAKKYGRNPNDLVAQAHFIVQQRPKITNMFKNATDDKSAQAAVKAFENFGVQGADRYTTAATILNNVNANQSAGTGLAGKIDPQLPDIGAVITSLQSKFTTGGPDASGASCQAKGGQPQSPSPPADSPAADDPAADLPDDPGKNLYGKVIDGGSLGPGQPTSIGEPDPNFNPQ